MPQVHLGERKPTMVRPDPALRDRMDDSAADHGYGSRQMNSYLVNLLGALHPDPKKHPEAAKAAAAVIEALLASARDMKAREAREAQAQLELPSLAEDHAAA
ncbi:hypothetical protein ACFV1N_46175 [Streptosporangium canum]|uniref:hypothetical protein n=1 Tax=Streptosporangium canum TaxID=324952 RepID=UPI0036C38202